MQLSKERHAQLQAIDELKLCVSQPILNTHTRGVRDAGLSLPLYRNLCARLSAATMGNDVHLMACQVHSNLDSVSGGSRGG